jgi:serine/threonine protein kinase
MLNQFTTTALDKVKREIEIMQDIVHPHVVALREILLDDVDDKLYLVMELCEGGELFSWDSRKRLYKNHVFSPEACQTVLSSCSHLVPPPTKPTTSLGGLPQNFAKLFISQAITALEYLHASCVVHRDIKPENLLLHANGSVKFADFGVANKFPPASETGGVAERCLSDSNGTYQYFSPEQCGGQEFDAYGADIWAFGMTCYVTLYGKLPYFSDHAAELFDRIQHAPIEYPMQASDAYATCSEPSSLSQCPENEKPELVREFLSLMLNRDATQRATIHQIKACSISPSFTQGVSLFVIVRFCAMFFRSTDGSKVLINR